MSRLQDVRVGSAVLVALVLCACVAPPHYVPHVSERACYRTLARVECHAQPLPGEEARRVGYFDWAAL